MALGVNNSVAFCGKNNALKKLAEKKVPAEIVDKLGVEVPKEIELAKRPKAEQMEALMQKAVLDSSFREQIAKILGKVQ